MSSRSSWNCSLIDSLSRMRMTASSPCTLGMIETRKSIVLPGSRSLKRPSCGTRFSAMSSSAMTFTREMIVLWKRLSIGRIAGCSTPSIAVLHVHRVVLRLDVDVARAALDRGVDGRVDQPDDRARVGRQLVDGQLLVAGLVFAQDLQLEALGRLLEHARRALALLQDRLDRRRRADRDLDRRRRAAPPARRSSAGRSDPTRRSRARCPRGAYGTNP